LNHFQNSLNFERPTVTIGTNLLDCQFTPRLSVFDKKPGRDFGDFRHTGNTAGTIDATGDFGEKKCMIF